MAVESPAEIFVIGHNRLSIEAGLYARFLGYRVTILGGGLSRAGTFDDDSKFSLEKCTTTLGRKALEAHDHALDELLVTHSDSLFENYVVPLSNSDLLSESFNEDCDSIDVGIGESELPEKLDEDVEYDTRVFDLKVKLKSGESVVYTADVLMDFRDLIEQESLSVDTKFEGEASHAEKAGAELLITPTQDFYLLRREDSADEAGIPFGEGLSQIVRLFQILSDRPQLNLYQ